VRRGISAPREISLWSFRQFWDSEVDFLFVGQEGYWGVGRVIPARQRLHGWGAKVVDRLAADLRNAFPEMAGLSPRNLKYMGALAEAYPDEPFVQQVVAQIP